MIKISAVIITFNEERNIQRCISSLQDVADEILVIDSFSQDKTKEICMSNSIRFIERKWEGFGNTKNYGNQQATYDFILSVDADEELSPDLKKAILEIKTTANPDDAFEMNRLSNYCGQWIKHSGWYPDRKLRIWNRQLGYWDNADVHERIEFKSHVNRILLKGDLHHYSYYSYLEHFQRIAKYSSLSAEKAFKSGKKSNLIKILLSPCLRFLRNYFLKAGFMDGFSGFVISRIEAYGVFVKYLTLYKLNK